jgi:hypothetical protein
LGGSGDVVVVTNFNFLLLVRLELPPLMLMALETVGTVRTKAALPAVAVVAIICIAV